MFRKKLLSAFTLVELLIVIAVMGVLAGAVLVSINPQEKIYAANDARVQSDVGQLVGALQAFAANNATGIYPTTAQGLAQLVTSGELTVLPAAPSGYAAYTFYGATTVAKVSGEIKSAKFRGAVTAPASYCWLSSTGTAVVIAGAPTANATCP